MLLADVSKLPPKGVVHTDLSHLMTVGMLRLDLVSSLNSKHKKAYLFNKIFGSLISSL